MARQSENILTAVMAAETYHGEAAEAFAKAQADDAARVGDAAEATHWQRVAADLHALHSINQRS